MDENQQNPDPGPDPGPPGGEGGQGAGGPGGAGPGPDPNFRPQPHPQPHPQPQPFGDMGGLIGGAGMGGAAGAAGAGPAPASGPAPVQGAYSQQIAHSPVSARVPERVARGVMTTGVIVLDSPNEFVLDFLQSLSRPPSIVARVVLAPGVMFSFVQSVRDNLGKYAERFGPPAPLPKPPQPQNRPTIQELYEHFKLPEELMSGTYANSVLIGHSPSEFVFDFITGFYPTAAVSSRVYLSAQQAPRVLETLTAAVATFQKRFQPRPQQQQQPPPPPPQGPEGQHPPTV